MKIDDRKPFTYLIGWSSLGKWYYGVRYGKRCHPRELWTTYYTSSKYVRELREQVGEPDVVQVRKTFSSVEDAAAWETRVLKRMDVIHRSDFLNVSYCTASGSLRAVLSEETKAKIGRASKGRRTFLGRKHTEETKAKMRTKVFSKESREQMSRSAKMKPPITEETRAKQSLARRGIKRSEDTKAKMRATWEAKKAAGYKWPVATEETKAKHRAREQAKRTKRTLASSSC